MPPSNYIGHRFGMLVAKSKEQTKYIDKRSGRRKPSNKSGYRCLCDCGREITIPTNYLTNGHSKHCGCMSRKVHDLAGMKFNELTAISRVRSNGNVTSMWKCLCTCGSEAIFKSNELRDGLIKSCGCVGKRTKNKKPSTDSYTNHYKQRHLGNYYYKCKKEGMAFSITEDQFWYLCFSDCLYCGKASDIGNFKLNGVDRIDNKIGYEYNNCAPCCSTCNLMKSDMSMNDFIDHTSKIASKYLNYPIGATPSD